MEKSVAEKSVNISFQCTSCDADFELEIPRIIDRPTALKCPNCDNRPQPHRAHALGTAIEDLLSAMAAIRTKVRFEIALDTEDLPPPYGPAEASAGTGLTDLVDDDLDVDADGDDDDDDDDDEKDEDEDLDDEDRDLDEDEDGDDDEEAGESDDDDFDLDDDDDDDEEEEEEEDED